MLPHKAPPGTMIAECTTDPGDNDHALCSNLLPKNWRDLQASEKVAGLFTKVRDIPLQDGMREQLRDVKATSGCDATKNFKIKYRFPVDVRHLPSGGTGGRDVVIAVFGALRDNNCAEGKYGIRAEDTDEKNDGFKRQLQFVVASTRAVVGSPDIDTEIGGWQLWVIERKPSDSTPVAFRMRQVTAGQYILCGGKHKSNREYEFLNCEDARRAQAVADSNSKDKLRTIGDVLRRYRAHDNSVIKALGDNYRPESASAWGQCGNLGCCAAR